MPAVSRRRKSPYAAAALPENHPPLAARLPTGGLASWLWGLAILSLPAVTLGLAIAGDWLLPTPFEAAIAARWGGSVEAARAIIDPTAGGLLGVWFGQLMLLAAAWLCGTVRHMRRQRIDDYRGRFRSWGWMGLFFVVAAAASILPLGRLVAAVVSEASGVALGPAGNGWWMLTVAIAWLAVGLWAIVPLERRTGPAVFLSASLAAWLTAGGIAWLSPATPGWMLAWHGLQGFVGPLAALGSLLAARGVILEARGERPEPGRQPKRPAVAEAVDLSDEPDAADEPDAEAEPPAEAPFDEPLPSAGADESDGSSDDNLDTAAHEPSRRKLSKAERKRLRREARKHRAA